MGSSRQWGLAAGYLLLLAGSLSLYASTAAVRHVVDDWVSFAERAAIPSLLPGLPPVSVLDFIGSALCCMRYRSAVRATRTWFEVLVACTLMQFGGTTLTGLLLGQVPSWLMSRSALPALVLAWWLTFCCPGDYYWRTLQRHRSMCMFVYGLLASVSFGHAVTSWGADKALFNVFHVNNIAIRHAHFVVIMCGTLSGCGGGILCDMYGMLRSSQSFIAATTPSIFAAGNYSASTAMTKAFLSAVLYFCLVSETMWSNPLPFASGRSIIVLFNIGLFLQTYHAPDVDLLRALVLQLRRTLGINDVIDLGEGVKCE